MLLKLADGLDHEVLGDEVDFVERSERSAGGGDDVVELSDDRRHGIVSGGESGEPRRDIRSGHGAGASIHRSTERHHALGDLVRKSARVGDQRVELLVDRREVAALYMPVRLLRVERQCDQVDQDGLQMLGHRLAGDLRCLIGRHGSPMSLAVVLGTTLARTIAQVADIPALVAAAHGTRSSAGRATITELRAAVATARPGLEVVEAYVDEDVQRPGLTEVLDGAGPAVVVPVLLSAGYHVHHDIARAVAGAGEEVVAARPLGPDEALVEVLARRLDGARGHDIILAAAGSSDERAGNDVRWTAAQLGERLGCEVTPAFVTADVPRVDDAVARLKGHGRRVAIASYVLAPGHFHDELRGQPADVVTEPLLPDERIADLVLRRYDAARVA
jgi:sirohydrochlorin ferrochelatase